MRKIVGFLTLTLMLVSIGHANEPKPRVDPIKREDQVPNDAIPPTDVIFIEPAPDVDPLAPRISFTITTNAKRKGRSASAENSISFSALQPGEYDANEEVIVKVVSHDPYWMVLCSATELAGENGTIPLSRIYVQSPYTNGFENLNSLRLIAYGDEPGEFQFNVEFKLETTAKDDIGNYRGAINFIADDSTWAETQGTDNRSLGGEKDKRHKSMCMGLSTTADVLPWINVDISKTQFIWEIFKPGLYMSRAFIMWLEANCPVHVAFGDAPLDYPVCFDSVANEWVYEPYTGPREPVNDKIRVYSLLTKENPGTPPDLIDIKYLVHESAESPAECTISPEEWALIQSLQPDDWYDYLELSAAPFRFEDLENGKYVTFFESIDIDACDSEGKYFEEFSITISPADP